MKGSMLWEDMTGILLVDRELAASAYPLGSPLIPPQFRVKNCRDDFLNDTRKTPQFRHRGNPGTPSILFEYQNEGFQRDRLYGSPRHPDGSDTWPAETRQDYYGIFGPALFDR